MGEVFLKGRNRPRFLRRLLQNVERVVRSLDAEVEPTHGRIFVRVPRAQVPEAVERLGCVFGLTSFSPIRVVEPTLESLEAAAVKELEAALKQLGWGSRGSGAGKPTLAGGKPTFKVDTRRSDKSFPMQSPEISRAVGGALQQRFGLPVSLGAPDLKVEVEIGRQRSFVTSGRHPGAGGLPVGASGPVTLLLSGGIDSPVAGWLLAKRGCPLLPITFESPPYTGPEARDKVRDLCARLARWTGPLALRVIRFTDAQLDIQRRCPPRLAVVLYRRMMLRVAALAAADDGALVLGTGDSVGQVASQTLENLHSIAGASALPVLRPLITYDKAETIALAEAIGTFDISIRPHVDCCSLFVPDHPETAAPLDRVQEAERALGDVQARARELLDTSERVDVPDPW
jgi:thiamine biosynthesis protein ThiI